MTFGARVAHVGGEVGDAPVVALRGERAPFDFGRLLDCGEEEERRRRLARAPYLRGGLLGLEAANALRRFDDCLLYVVGRLPDEPDAVLVYEVWTSAEAHRGSLDREETKAAIARGRPLIAGMSDRVEFEPAGGKGI